MALRVDGVLFDNLTADPGTPEEGQVWYNSTDDKVKVYRNGQTVTLVDKPEFEVHSLSTSNPHTTTLEQARTAGSTLSGAINMNSFAINNVGGSVGTDAASRQYVVDQIKAKIQGLDWQESVLDKDLATPPVSPSTGDRYIVATGGTGAWATKDKQIAEWDGAAWVFSVPNEGFTTRVMDENKIYTYDGTNWGLWDAVVDHGSLLGLADDDHTQYLLVNGTRAMSGALDMGTNAITNVGNVDGVDVSDHSARHDPGGTDELTTAAPGATSVATASATGTATSFARSDHVHQSNTAPANVTKAAAAIGTSGEPARADHKHDISTAAASELTDSTNAEGSATSLARSDHTHAHGNRSGGTLHALASTSGHGFHPKSNFAAVVNPTVNDDGTAGYVVGSRWVNTATDEEFICTDNGTGAALWKSTTASSGSSLQHKAGRVLAASFAGTPKKATVTFGAAMPNTNYSITLTCLTANSRTFAPTSESKTTGGFTINIGSNVTTDLTEVGWQVMADGESS
jgi:hypothetical protein